MKRQPTDAEKARDLRRELKQLWQSHLDVLSERDRLRKERDQLVEDIQQVAANVVGLKHVHLFDGLLGEWEGRFWKAVLDAATVIENPHAFGSDSRRANCPLCHQSAPGGAFTYGEGLYRHVVGWGSQRCPVAAPCFATARKVFSKQHEEKRAKQKPGTAASSEEAPETDEPQNWTRASAPNSSGGTGRRSRLNIR